MDDALKHCAELTALFGRHAGGWLDRERLSRVTELCARTSAAVEDLHARSAWGTDVLRERILFSIEAIEGRASRAP